MGLPMLMETKFNRCLMNAGVGEDAFSLGIT